MHRYRQCVVRFVPVELDDVVCVGVLIVRPIRHRGSGRQHQHVASVGDAFDMDLRIMLVAGNEDSCSCVNILAHIGGILAPVEGVMDEDNILLSGLAGNRELTRSDH